MKKEKYLINFVILSLLLIILNSIFIISAQDISAEGITTITDDVGSEFIFDDINKIYEISESSLEKGYSTFLKEMDAFKLTINEKNYYIILWDILAEDIKIIFPGKRQLIFKINDEAIIDIDQDNDLDVKIKLKAVENFYDNQGLVAKVEVQEGDASIKETEYVPGKKAEIHIIKFFETEIIPKGDYLQLFDINLFLTSKVMYNPRNLVAYVNLENFGEGPSELNLVYSIINEYNEEVFKGVDSKIVRTELTIKKEFDFLKLPTGRYLLETEIFYGDNQTGKVAQDFEIIEMPFFEPLSNVLFFILTIAILVILVFFMRSFYKKNKKGGENV